MSRHPLLETGVLEGDRTGSWARIRASGREILVVNPHPPCCDDDAGRQRVFDAMAAWIRDAKASGRIPPGTPIVIAGDMNLVGDSRQLATLLEGAIADTSAYGPASPPDWDGTPFLDAFPVHLTGAECYTWRNDEGPFAPGRLDYVVYSDSVLKLARGFVLWTPDLPEEVLGAFGLRPEDTTASDHLPVVVDFSVEAPSSR